MTPHPVVFVVLPTTPPSIAVGRRKADIAGIAIEEDIGRATVGLRTMEGEG
jgi:hypothetical protein